jgi:hypothetical protein
MAVTKAIATALFSYACIILSITASAADERRSVGAGGSEASAGKKSAAESVTLAQLIQKYKAGDYTSAAKIGEIVVKHNAEDGVTHYYYASALVKLNRKEEAIEEFRKAYNRTEQPTLKSYCEEAISALSQPHSESHNAPAAATAPDQAPRDFKQTSSASVSLQEKDLLERKATILEEGANQIDHLRQQAGEDIKKLKQNVTDQMVDVPQQIMGWRGRRIANPDYASMLGKLNSEAQEGIDKINAHVDKETAEITENCNRRAAAYDETMPNMNSQLKTGKSQIQLMPQNSNPYLRNFVNYDGSIPGALKAKAGTLPANAVPLQQKDH